MNMQDHNMVEDRADSHVVNSTQIQAMQPLACADQESFARGGPTLTTFFYEGREDPNSTKRGPPSASARQRLNGVSLAG